MQAPKKILAIHDLCAHGRVSLKAATPILTSCGHEVYPLPTALLSAHTQYPQFTFLDLTDEMVKILASWRTLDVKVDSIYTGFLGSPQQVDIVLKAIEDFGSDRGPVVVDPVMGDNGKLYAAYDLTLVAEMRRLVQKADIVVPNLTELAYLLDRPYTTDLDEATLREAMKALSDMGPKIVVVTGVPVQGRPDRISVWAYEKATDTVLRVEKPYIQAHLPGTGDAFASVLTASLLRGETLGEAMDRAAQFIVDGILAAQAAQTPLLDGILAEPLLPTLLKPLTDCETKAL